MCLSNHLNNIMEDVMRLRSVIWLPVCFGVGVFGGYKFGYKEGFKKGYKIGKKEIEKEISKIKDDQSSLNKKLPKFQRSD